MAVETIISLIVLGVVALGGIATIIVAIVRGEMKKFIIEKMAEADILFKDVAKPEKSIKKLQYVVESVKDKYKIMEIVLNVKKFVEKIIDISKQINAK